MAETKFKSINKTNKEEAIKAILNYKHQNPSKYEGKKVALMERYGITPEDLGEKVEKVIKKEKEETTDK